MKIAFIDEYEEVIKEITGTLYPPIGANVYLNEDAYYVTNIVWDVDNDQVKIVLSEQKLKEPRENKEFGSNGLKEAMNAQKDAKQALKETKALKTQLFSIRQYLRSTKK